VRILLDHFGIDRAALVGMSQGARIALRVSIAWPKRVAGLVLDGAPFHGFRPESRGEDAIPLDEYAALARRGRLDEMKKRWRQHALMQGIPDERQALFAMILNDYAARDLISESVQLLQPIADRLVSIDVPALVITGEHDTAWRRLVGDTLAQILPNSRRAVIPGGHHLCNASHPENYNRLLTEFAASLP